MSYSLNDLQAFLSVAQVRSFTKAAAKMGVSQSALSHTIRNLEERLGVRLLTRTTRSVSPTEAGERLLATIAPRLEEIEAELAALSDFRDKPVGTIRITAAEHGATMLWPKIAQFLPRYPEIKVEINVNYGMIDIVEEQFDMGLRLGDQVAKDMIAVRVGPDLRLVVVAAPAYFAQRELPQSPHELTTHNCIGLRLQTHGSLYAWEFEKNGQVINVKVDGQLVFNGSAPILKAVLAGLGVAFLPEDIVLEHIQAGRLVQVLDDWCPSFPGYHIYYPSRRQSSPAFKLLVDALRYK
jgi:DNA-binding transcriptional LysR family regulator